MNRWETFVAKTLLRIERFLIPKAYATHHALMTVGSHTCQALIDSPSEWVLVEYDGEEYRWYTLTGSDREPGDDYPFPSREPDPATDQEDDGGLLPWGETDYDSVTPREVVDDFVLARGDLSTSYARQQLADWIERYAPEAAMSAGMWILAVLGVIGGIYGFLALLSVLLWRREMRKLTEDQHEHRWKKDGVEQMTAPDSSGIRTWVEVQVCWCGETRRVNRETPRPDIWIWGY